MIFRSFGCPRTRLRLSYGYESLFHATSGHGLACAWVVTPAFSAQTVSDYNPDANGDNIIDVQDLLAILGLFGTEWGDSATGCTYPNAACNYNPTATADDGSCLFVVDALGGPWRRLPR